MDYIRKTFTFEGKRYTVRGKTEKEAIIKMANKIRDLEEGRIVISGNMTVREWAAECVETYKTKQSAITRKKYLNRMEACVLSEIGSRKLKDIKKIELMKVLNKQAGKSNFQIKATRQMLNFLFSKAHENHLIAENPAENLDLPAGHTEKRRKITAKEEEHFLRACEDDRFLVFLLMFYCGCRPSEARNALGKDIRKKNGYNVLHITGEKSKNADRYVPIPSAFYERIKSTPPFSPIAPSRSGNQHTEGTYNAAVRALRRTMNISMGCKVYRNQLVPPYPLAADFVPYDLRHTYCCNLKKAGVDIRNAKYLMGHSDIALTANIYTHEDDDDIITAARQILSYEQAGVTVPVTQACGTVEK